MTPQSRDNKWNGCFQKGRKRKCYVPGTSMMCNDLSTKTVYLLFVLFYFVLLFYFTPLAMLQRRNLKNSKDNREVALLRLTVRFTRLCGCLRKHTEAFVTVHLEKAIKAVSTDRNRSQIFSSRWWVLKREEKRRVFTSSQGLLCKFSLMDDWIPGPKNILGSGDVVEQTNPKTSFRSFSWRWQNFYIPMWLAGKCRTTRTGQGVKNSELLLEIK